MSNAFDIRNLNVRYGAHHAVKDVTIGLPHTLITAIIGPSGCGKSSFLRALNRMNDLVPGCTISGEILFHGSDIYDPQVSDVSLRRRVGMVFQKPNPFPFSVFDNIAYGLRIQGIKDKALIAGRVEESLKRAALWPEVKDRLRQSAFGLSGGQQQRLCIARALAVEPEVLLLDEPCASLDPTATARVEELLRKLEKEITIIIVTHNMQQAKRMSDVTGFFHMGTLVEFGKTAQVFEQPKEELTREYVTGHFG